MSEDWSKLTDIDPLADGRVRIGFAIPLSEFPRLRSQLACADGAVSGHASFGRERGMPVADVEVEGSARLTCQRCLEPFDFALQSTGRVAVVADGAEADRAPVELETVLAPGHRISLRDLVEEELLLALPLVPRHPQECVEVPQASAGEELQGGERQVADEADRSQETHRPFERLNELFKRDG